MGEADRLTRTPDSEGDVLPVLAPGHQVDPEALRVSGDGRGCLSRRRQHQVIRHVHYGQSGVV